MPELRLDPVTRRWIATGKRPVMPDVVDTGGACPFCSGNEHLTPKSIQEWREANGAWSVRVFHDRAPLFRIEGGLDRRGESIYDRMNTVGAHEIVVETPQHGVTLAQLSPQHIARVAEVCRDRILDLKRDRRFRYVSLFKDQHPPSPTYQGHSYSQIIASPVLPQVMEVELRWCRTHYSRKERCIFCDIIQQEIRVDQRVVDSNADFIALCPFASRSPYEMWVLPQQHSSSFEKDLLEPGRALAMASFLKACLQRQEKISPQLHVVAHTEPNLESHKPTKDWWGTLPDDFHWHIEIHPDVEGERRYLGSEGFYFNPIPAEQAALVLRALEPGDEPPPPSP
jgi:UDPglucose--hexose-1-phosphate uridylyltransferase